MSFAIGDVVSSVVGIRGVCLLDHRPHLSMNLIYIVGVVSYFCNMMMRYSRGSAPPAPRRPPANFFQPGGRCLSMQSSPSPAWKGTTSLVRLTAWLIWKHLLPSSTMQPPTSPLFLTSSRWTLRVGRERELWALEHCCRQTLVRRVML